MTAEPESFPFPIYESKEALRFATAWTGLDAALVERVLNARHRYLELAGIASCDEDDALLGERERYGHLLPEGTHVIDEEETEYLIQVTGVDEASVRRILQGDMAYLDSMGLVTWDDEEERDSTLGAPEGWEAEQFGVSQEDEGDDPMFEGHGEHWECVVPDVAPFIEPHLAELPGVEHLRFHVPSPSPCWEGVTARAIPQTAILETLRLDGDQEYGSEIISAFPVARDGAIHPLVLHRVRRWEVGCEAVVIASTSFGASIAYFDTAFLHPWNTWEPDEERDIAIAGFAYSLEPAPMQVIAITQEDKIRALRSMEQDVAPEEVTDLSPLEIRTEGMACLFPRQGGNPDEFAFQGPVVGVDVLYAWEQTLYRLDVTVMRDATGEEVLPFTLPIYVAQHRLPKGYRPRVGDDVRGVLWLQGTPVRLRCPMIVEG